MGREPTNISAPCKLDVIREIEKEAENKLLLKYYVKITTGKKSFLCILNTSVPGKIR